MLPFPYLTQDSLHKIRLFSPTTAMRKTKIICTPRTRHRFPRKASRLDLGRSKHLPPQHEPRPHDWVRTVVKDIRKISADLGVMTGILLDTGTGDSDGRVEQQS